MNCKSLREKYLSDFLDDRLDGVARSDVRAHIDACPTCAGETKNLECILLQVKELRDTRAPENLWPGIKQRLGSRLHGVRSPLSFSLMWAGLAPKALAVMLVVAVAILIPVYNTTLSAQAQLHSFQIELDANTIGRSDQYYLEFMVGQFNLTPDQVNQLRQDELQWGELALVLFFGQHLVQAHTETFPTLGQAVGRTLALRQEGKDWGRIARDLHIQLRPIVLKARHARAIMRSGEIPGSSRRMIPQVREVDERRSEVFRTIRDETRETRIRAGGQDDSLRDAQEALNEAAQSRREAQDLKKE